MTIVSFCRDQLLTDGPLPLDELTRRAVNAGVTRSSQPASSVRSALRNRAVQLPDQRWASPLWLLEGRVLTTHSFGQPLQYDEDGYRHGPDHHESDLGLLLRAAQADNLLLSTGGVVKRAAYGSDWRFPKGWKPVIPGRFQLLGLRIFQGMLHIEQVDRSPELQRRGQDLRLTLEPFDGHSPRGFYGTELDRVQQSLEEQLWRRLAADPTFLSEPVPPFSECVPALEDAIVVLRSEQERQRERQRECWHAQLELPRSVQWIAQQAADRDGLEMTAWLEQLVAATLTQLPDLADRDDSAEVLRFPRWR
jgi:hypothetical protein